MAELNTIITFLVASRPGITDQQLCEAIYGEGVPAAIVANRCRALEETGKIRRRRRFVNASFTMANYPHSSLRITHDQHLHDIVVAVGE